MYLLNIGTVVMPQARLKFYLDADLAERARRRCADLVAEGRTFSQDEVSSQLQERDNLDSTRNDSPLRPAEDAEILDCTACSAEQVVDLVVTRFRAVCP